jgi:hypothetical protein
MLAAAAGRHGPCSRTPALEERARRQAPAPPGPPFGRAAPARAPPAPGRAPPRAPSSQTPPAPPTTTRPCLPGAGGRRGEAGAEEASRAGASRWVCGGGRGHRKPWSRQPFQVNTKIGSSGGAPSQLPSKRTLGHVGADEHRDAVGKAHPLLARQHQQAACHVAAPRDGGVAPEVVPQLGVRHGGALAWVCVCVGGGCFGGGCEVQKGGVGISEQGRPWPGASRRPRHPLPCPVARPLPSTQSPRRVSRLPVAGSVSYRSSMSMPSPHALSLAPSPGRHPPRHPPVAGSVSYRSSMSMSKVGARLVVSA